jgi:choline-glycine betaine transporter
LGLLILSSGSTDPLERLRPFQTIILLISPPLIIVYILMAMSLIKSIREDTS